MAAMNVVDDRVVYVAFNSIFQGQDSQIRKLAPIRRLVAKHQEQPQVAQLLEEYSAPVIYEILQRLLVGQVFESTLKAKTEFPGLFEVSRAQSADRAMSEAEAAAGHAKAVEEAIACSDRYGKTYDSDYDSGGWGTDLEPEEATRSPMEQESAHLGIGVPSLFPLEFNFITGHRILIKTQEVLELACFGFVEKTMPEILEKRKWHCPESAELNLWAIEFLKRLGRFERKHSKMPSSSKPLKELFPSIAQIRHHAVHRIPVTAKELEQFMADGETLAQLFEDQTAIRVMSKARGEVEKAAAEMENRKNMLETRLTKVLQEVAHKRAELDRLEADAIADMQQKDKEYQLFAGAHLQDTIWSDDSVTGKGPSVARRATANDVDHECLEDQFDNDLGPDMISLEDTKIQDPVEEGQKPGALGDTLVDDVGGGWVAIEIGQAPTESRRLADVDGDGYAAKVEKRGEPSNSLPDIDGRSASGSGGHICLKVSGSKI